MVHNDIHAFFMLYQHRDPASSKQRITEYSKQDPATSKHSYHSICGWLASRVYFPGRGRYFRSGLLQLLQQLGI